MKICDRPDWPGQTKEKERVLGNQMLVIEKKTQNMKQLK